MKRVTIKLYSSVVKLFTDRFSAVVAGRRIPVGTAISFSALQVAGTILLVCFKTSVMIKGIPKNKHGLLDFTYIPLVLAAPELVGFTADSSASALCRVSGITVLTYTLLTDAKWGVVKIIPYKVHAALDVSMGAVAVASSILREGYSGKKARNTLLAMGLISIVVGSLSLIGAKRR